MNWQTIMNMKKLFIIIITMIPPMLASAQVPEYNGPVCWKIQFHNNFDFILLNHCWIKVSHTFCFIPSQLYVRQHLTLKPCPGLLKPQRVVGFCDSLFKPLTMWGEVWWGVGTPLRQEGAGCCENLVRSLRQRMNETNHITLIFSRSMTSTQIPCDTHRFNFGSNLVKIIERPS